MDISIGKLTITSFCLENIEHLKFRNDLQKDELIYEFVSTSIEDDFYEVYSDNLELENSYIIKFQNTLVGYIYLTKLAESEGLVELRYAVHPKYRRLGYGRKILEECRKYLFTLDNINGIELHIRKDNESSIYCAKRAKYKCIGENNNEYFYIYKSMKRDDNNEN